MTKFMRYLLFVISAMQAIMAIAFFLQLPFVINIWPFEGTTPLTYIFISSIFAAAAAGTFWAVITENYGALVGIGLDYITIMTPLSIILFRHAANTGEVRAILFGIMLFMMDLFGLFLILWSIRFPLDRTLPLPAIVRWSFVIFTITLLIVSTRLILQIPNTIPWSLTPQLSQVIGWMFLGASTYFIYALLRPSWANAGGQLAAFLAYDVVLIVPFLQRLPTVAPEFRLGLIIYTVVVIYSGVMAAYFLFFHRVTRVRARMPA